MSDREECHEVPEGESNLLNYLNEVDRIDRVRKAGYIWCIPTCIGVSLFISVLLKDWGWIVLALPISLYVYYLIFSSYLEARIERAEAARQEFL